MSELRRRPYSLGLMCACEAGVCGSCGVTFTAAETVHRDICLKPAERRNAIITCVSRARGRIELAL